MSVIYLHQAGVDKHKPSNAGCWCSRDLQSFTSKHPPGCGNVGLGECVLLLTGSASCSWSTFVEFQVHSSPAFPPNWLTKAPCASCRYLRYLGSEQSLYLVGKGWLEGSLTGKSCLEIPNHSKSWWDHFFCVNCGFHSGYFIVLNHGGRGNQCEFVTSHVASRSCLFLHKQTAFQTIPECSDSCSILIRSCDPERTLGLGSSLHICLHLPGAPVHLIPWELALLSASKALVKNILHKKSICLAVTLSQIIVFTLSLRCVCREAPVSDPGIPKLEFLPLLSVEIIPSC